MGAITLQTAGSKDVGVEGEIIAVTDRPTWITRKGGHWGSDVTGGGRRENEKTYRGDLGPLSGRKKRVEGVGKGV